MHNPLLILYNLDLYFLTANTLSFCPNKKTKNS